jgi:hypothetical protein
MINPPSPFLPGFTPGGVRRRTWSGLIARWWWRVLLFAGLGVAAAQAEISKEYQVKAAFLYNFTKFVQWPPERFADEQSPLVIGVFGPNPFGGELERVVEGRLANGRTLVVRPVATVAQIREAHVVFVPEGEEARFAQMAAGSPPPGVLTVGESEAFTVRGGVIVFTLEVGKIRFVINLDPAERAGLKLSAQLLRLATEVHRK